MPELRKLLPSGNWQATYRDAAGRRHSKTFPTKSMARAWAGDAEATVRAGTHRSPSSGKIKVSDWYAKWLAARVVESATAAKNRTHSKYVLERWGDWPLVAIERMDVQGWVAQMQAAGKGAETIGSTVRLLSAVLQSAVEAHRIPTNVAKGVTLPTASKQPDRYLSKDEVDQVVAALPEPYATAALMSAYTGMRWGEVFGLHVHRLQLLRRPPVVHVVEVVQRDLRVKDYPKSTAGQRMLPLTPRLVDALAAHLRAGQTGLVFSTSARTGHKPLGYNNVRRVWQDALAGAPELPATRGRAFTPARPGAGLADPQPTWHDLRHTYASWLIAAGVDLRTVQVRMGHESLLTVQRYAHLLPDADSRVLAALAADLPLSDEKSHSSPPEFEG